jgi:arabinofuranosyltransferase
MPPAQDPTPFTPRSNGAPVHVSRRRSAARLLTAAGLLLFVAILVRHAWVCDDAFITFRTARNLASGDGLTWNLGERVQAYTHPLWMLLLSGAYLVTGDMYLSAMALSLAASIAAVCTAFLRLRGGADRLLLACMLVGSNAFMDYSSSGLENPLTHLLYAAFLVIALGGVEVGREGPLVGEERRRVARLVTCAALVALCRLDAILLCVPALGRLLFRLRKRPGLARTALLGAAPLLAWEVFSIVYYGVPFPNTAYAKLGTNIDPAVLASQGLHYLRATLRDDPFTLLVIAAGLVAALLGRDGRARAAALGVLLYLAYVVRIGGDFMEGRFLSAPLLGAALLLAWRAAPSLGKIGWFAPVPAAAFLGLAVLVTQRPTLSSGAEYGRGSSSGGQGAGAFCDDHGIADERAYYYEYTGLLAPSADPRGPGMPRWIDYGRALAQGGVTAQSQVGMMGYYAPKGAVIVDALGLTDPLMARLPMSAAPFRIGHFRRAVPDGYLESLEQGRNVIADPRIAELYDHIRAVVRGPLFSLHRFAEIWRLNAGSYDHLAAPPP